MIYIIHTYTLDNYVIQNLMKLITYNVLLLMYLHLIPRGTTFCSYSNLRSFRKKLGLQYDEDVLPVTHPHHIEDIKYHAYNHIIQRFLYNYTIQYPLGIKFKHNNV